MDDKPDNSIPGWGRYEWTAERVAKVREIAEAGGTAVSAALAVGIEPERAGLLYKLAKRENFRFRSHRRDDRAILVQLDDGPARELIQRAKVRKTDRRKLAAKLLNIVLLQGPTFIDNLLDDEA